MRGKRETELVYFAYVLEFGSFSFCILSVFLKKPETSTDRLQSWPGSVSYASSYFLNSAYHVAIEYCKDDQHD